MKIVFLSDHCDDFLQTQIENTLKEYQHLSYHIKEEDFKPCRGCFNCWTKTPGKCIIATDKANEINGFCVQADVIIILSKILYGSYSVDIKKYLDRVIPNILPYFEMINNEMHHKSRYDKFPSLIIIGYGEELTDEEKNTFKSLVSRNAINFHSPKHFSFAISSSGEKKKTIDEISRILMEEFK